MLVSQNAFSGFSADDLDAAEAFYRDVLGLTTRRNEMGILELVLPPSGARVIVYPKPDHVPATFTVLNLAVEDVDAAVTELNAAGVVTKIYGDDTGVPTDERGVMRGRGPTIAWFRDPAGNVLSVIAAD